MSWTDVSPRTRVFRAFSVHHWTCTRRSASNLRPVRHGLGGHDLLGSSAAGQPGSCSTTARMTAPGTDLGTSRTAPHGQRPVVVTKRRRTAPSFSRSFRFFPPKLIRAETACHSCMRLKRHHCDSPGSWYGTIGRVDNCHNSVGEMDQRADFRSRGVVVMTDTGLRHCIQQRREPSYPRIGMRGGCVQLSTVLPTPLYAVPPAPEASDTKV